ncbi:MAG: dTDP-4-dehydrorhamnose reductase [Sphingomonadaceae bacterium]
MKLIITGATGQVGTALLRAIPAGWSVLSPDRSQMDLAHPATIRAMIKRERPDLVINAAAYTAVDMAENEPELAYAINAGAVGVMAQSLAETGGRLVHISTDFVFDGQAARAWHPDDPPCPLSVYGRTKASGEKLAGDKALIVRTAWVYHAGGTNFVRTMLRLMRENPEVQVVADQISAPCEATALADVILELVRKSAHGIYHYSDAGTASWYDFAVAIQEEALALGLLDRAVPVIPISTDDYPVHARRPPFSLLESSATHAITGIRPVHWRVNLRKMLQEEYARG